MRSWRRPLEPTEVSWIIEGKIRGTIPIRMFPRPGEDAMDKQLLLHVSLEGAQKVVDAILGVEETYNK